MPGPDGDQRASRSLRREVSGRLAALRLTMAHPAMRRLQLSSLGFNTGEFAVTVALGVYAFADGGPAAVGIVTLLRTLPGVVFGPSLAVFTDRMDRRWALAGGLAARSGITAAIVVVLAADGIPALVYALAALDAAMASSFFPAAIAEVPELCSTAPQLSAANATSAVMEHGGILFGPVLAGAILSIGDVSAVFGAAAVVYLFGAVLAVRITSDRRPPEPSAGAGLTTELAAGARYLRRDRTAATVVAVWTFESLAVGASEVLVVVLALDVLGLGDPGVGWMGAALGLGGLAGAVAMATLERSAQFGRFLGLAILLMGIAFALAGILPAVVVAAVTLLVAGAAQSQADVAAQTLLQRRVPEDTLGRVLGLFEGMYWGALGIGAAGASWLTVVFGARTTLVALGVSAVIVAALTRAALSRIDQRAFVPEDRIDALSSSPIFSVLGVPTIERLARHAIEEEHAPGSVIVREGEPGEWFYVIVDGEVEVVAGATQVATLTSGDYFGEIALLNNSPRIATVRAITPLRLLALQGHRFLAAVASRNTSTREAESVAAGRMVQTARLRRGRLA